MISLGSQSQLGIGIAISLNNRFSSQAARINKDLMDMRRNAHSALTSAIRDYRNYSLAVAGGAAALSYGLFKAASTGAEFQHKINQTFIVGGKELGRTRKELESFARDLSKQFTRTPTEIADVMFENIKAGVSTGLEEITKYQIAVATATDEALAGSEGVGEKLLGIMHAMGMRATDQIEIGGKKMSQFQRIANATTAVSNATMASVYSIGESMEYFSNTAAVAGMTLEQTLALVGKLSQSKIMGSAAGTALNNMVQQLINSVGPFMTPKKKKAYGVLGIDPEQIRTMINEGNIYEAIEAIDRQSRKLSRVDRLTTFNALFNMRGQRGIVNAFLGGEKGLSDIRGAAERGVMGDVVTDQSKKMMNDFHSDIKFLSNAFHDFRIAFTNAVGPTFRAMVRVAGKAVKFFAAFVESPVGRILANIVAIGAPVVATLFAFKAAILSTILVLNSFSRAIGFGGLVRGGLGMLGGGLASRRGLAGVALNKRGNPYVAAGQTVTYGGRTYTAGQALPRAITGGAAGRVGMGMGNALGNFFGMGGFAAAAAGGSGAGTALSWLGKAGPWIARIGGAVLRFIPIVGLVWTAVELLRGIFGNTKERDETPEERAIRVMYENEKQLSMHKQVSTSVSAYQMFLEKYAKAGSGFLPTSKSPQLNQVLNINLDGRTIASQKLQTQLDDKATGQNDFNFTY